MTKESRRLAAERRAARRAENNAQFRERMADIDARSASRREEIRFEHRQSLERAAAIRPSAEERQARSAQRWSNVLLGGLLASYLWPLVFGVIVFLVIVILIVFA